MGKVVARYVAAEKSIFSYKNGRTCSQSADVNTPFFQLSLILLNGLNQQATILTPFQYYYSSLLE